LCLADLRLAGEVLYVFPASRSTWWAGINAGRFPKGAKLGPRITSWKVEEIQKLIESRY
jgi:predicted DNA-binding transcriptional regulator AlpA